MHPLRKIRTIGNSLRSKYERVPYNKELSANTAFGQPRDHGGVSDWTKEQGHFKDACTLGGARHPQGTPSAWFDANLEQDSYARWLIFQMPSSGAQMANNYSHPFAAFFAFVDALDPVPDVYSTINTYSQTLNEIYSGIDRYKSAANGKTIHWEISNEMYGAAYGDYVDTAFATLTGADLTTAWTYQPSGKFSEYGGDFVAKCQYVINYIRTHYPEDKIGIPVEAQKGHMRPDTTEPDWFQAAENISRKWTDNVITLDCDAVIEHPYIYPQSYWTLFRNGDAALYTDSKWLASTSEGAENCYRWMMAYAQDGPAKTMMHNRHRCANKDVWLTEYGNLLDPQDSGTSTDRPTEFTGQAAQAVWRVLWFVSYMISWLEQVAVENGRLKTIMQHAAVRGAINSTACVAYTAEVYPAAVSMSAQGIANFFMNQLMSGMTHFRSASMDISSIEKLGVLNYSLSRIKPVRVIYFDDGTAYRALVLNISPSTHDVTLDFTPASYLRFVAADHSYTLWSTIPVSTFYDETDFASAAHTSRTYTAPAYSVTVLE